MRTNKTPLLIDFGTARYAFGKNTKSLSAILTAGYAPVEQYDSKSLQGAFTDIYALGAMIYKMATYSVPPESTSRSLAKLRNSVDPLKPINSSNFSLEFKNAVHKALNVMEEDRYRSVEEFRKALGGIERPPKPSKDFKVLTLVALSSLLVGASSYVGVDYFLKWQKEKRIVEEIAKEKAEQQRIIDENTVTIDGLSWTKKTVKDKTFSQADEYCQDLELGGKSDWRLPTIDELRSVVDGCGGTSVEYSDQNLHSITYKNKANSSYQSCYVNKGFISSWYWSSDSLSGSTTTDGIVYFDNGGVGNGNKDNYFYLRCVRAGE
jgi:serine/threonine protein kinase